VERCVFHRGRNEKALTILIVEDDTPTREFISELLSQQGHVVKTAIDGARAQAQVAASLPELVILDLILPAVGGFELIAKWRGESRTADLPVFVLTSKDLTPEETNYLRTHASALFQKQEPWQDALLRQLQRILVPAVSEKS
jgi:DNA-binding response OmpR family regulator